MKNDMMKNDKISIAMMTTLSGPSFKGPQMPMIIKGLIKSGLLGNVYGIWSEDDRKEYGKYYGRDVQTSKFLKYAFALNKRICNLFSISHYIMQEKIYGIMAGHKNYKGNAILLKPCPGRLVKKFKGQGKTIIIEASENHPRYTFNELKRECLLSGQDVPSNNYTNEKHIKEFEDSIRMADYLICLSEFSAQTYIDQGFERSRIFITGLSVGDSIELPKLTQLKPITFVTVANHGILKGTHRLIELWNRLNIQNDLLIVGGIYPELRKFEENENNNPNIKFCGAMKREEIYKIYKSIPCVHVLLSVSESYGRSVYEALTKGVPQIVTPTCTCDYVKDGLNGYIVETHDIDGLQTAVKKYLDMSLSEYEAMRKNVYDSVKSIEDSFGNRYISALLNCMGGGNEGAEK